jgi:hypothetical protein
MENTATHIMPLDVVNWLARLSSNPVVIPAPLSWRIRNAPRKFSGWLLVQAAILFTRITRIPTITGKLSIRKVTADRMFVIDYGIVSYRFVTTAGVQYLIDNLQNLSEPEVFKYHAIGTGVAAESIADTALGAEWAGADYTGGVRATGTQGEGAAANVYRTVATNTKASAGVTAITEHMVMSQAATGGGTGIDRSVFAAMNLGQNDGLQTTYDFTINAGG